MTSSALSQPRPAQFPDLLRSWRKHRKLSQWDLSLTAGISQRHLSFLESGRSSPSREMVLRLADTLDVPLQEQNTLLGSAGFAPIFQEASLDDDSLSQARQALEVMLEHHEPYPCLVVDKNWNMLMSNNANIRLFSMFVDPLGVWADVGDTGSQNLVKLVLHPKGLKPYVTNWDQFARYFLHGLEQELRFNPYSIQTRALREEIGHYPDMPEDISRTPPSNLPFLSMQLKKGDLELNLFTMVSTFGIPHDITLQQLRIETFFPSDEKTEATIREI